MLEWQILLLLNVTLMRTYILSLLLLISCSCRANDVILQDLDGHDIPFNSLKGKWVFINYWASWCHPCVDEIAELNRFYTQHKTDNVAVFAVNFDAPRYKQQRLIRKFSIQYPSLLANSVAALPLGNIEVVPITFVFNPQGELATTLYGGQTLASFNEILMGVS